MKIQNEKLQHMNVGRRVESGKVYGSQLKIEMEHSKRVNY